MAGWSFSRPDNSFAEPGIAGAAARWIAGALVLTLGAWLVGFAGLLALANRVHTDIPRLLAVRLPLLQSHPKLIFAGESRTEYGVDPVLAGELLGKPPGYAVNIAYDAGEPLAVAAAARAYPDVFRDAHVVVSVAPFIFNEGVKSAGVYPLDVAARLDVGTQLVTFLPMRVGTLVRYIHDAFEARLAQQQNVATTSSVPPDGGVIRLTRQAQGRDNLGGHPHYARWRTDGPKARYAIEALCDIAAASRKLTVVNPPWVPGDRRADTAWMNDEADINALLRAAGKRCRFETLVVTDVPGLAIANFSDEMHVNASGVPIYTRYLMSQLPR
ncbi:hypothetical protein [Bradyrhizobium sp. 2TAF24]|uniref:hypothetical protein n=1 Tax=Bradyrhizobium sp. 2TAF24 TaxID=3233011 RepID=UPI003F8EE15A